MLTGLRNIVIIAETGIKDPDSRVILSGGVILVNKKSNNGLFTGDYWIPDSCIMQ
jgi:hypothetical protein